MLVDDTKHRVEAPLDYKEFAHLMQESALSNPYQTSASLRDNFEKRRQPRIALYKGAECLRSLELPVRTEMAS